MRAIIGFSILVAGSAGSIAGAADCNKTTASEEIATCLGEELRTSDTHINESYQSVLKLLDEVGQKALRAEQRSWLKERNTICKLNTRESDRERWYQALLTDYSKTVCVTRYTRVRATELDQMLATRNAAKATAMSAAPPAPIPMTTPMSMSRAELFPKSPHAYWLASTHSWSKGRWYWEATVKADGIANIHPTTLSIGCSNDEGGTGVLVNLRPSDTHADRGTVVYGIAIDLVDGKVYPRKNGEWMTGEPGSIKGRDIKLNRLYSCGITSTIAVAPLQKANLLEANFGGKPFVYSMPDGYKPVAVP